MENRRDEPGYARALATGKAVHLPDANDYRPQLRRSWTGTHERTLRRVHSEVNRRRARVG
jgi:hypothetical protein